MLLLHRLGLLREVEVDSGQNVVVLKVTKHIFIFVLRKSLMDCLGAFILRCRLQIIVGLRLRGALCVQAPLGALVTGGGLVAWRLKLGKKRSEPLSYKCRHILVGRQTTQNEVEYVLNQRLHKTVHLLRLAYFLQLLEALEALHLDEAHDLLDICPSEEVLWIFK